MAADVLADADPVRVAAGEVQRVLSGEPVVEDHVGFLQAFHGAERQEIPRAGAGAHEGDVTAVAAARNPTRRERGVDQAGGARGVAPCVVRRRGALEDPGPERAAPGGGQAGGDPVAETAGERGECAEVRGEHALDPGTDVAGEDRGGALGPDGDHDRVAVDEGGGGQVAEFGAVDDVDLRAARLGEGVQAGVGGGTAGADEDHGGVGEGGGCDGARMVDRTAVRDAGGEFGTEVRRGEDDRRVGTADQAGLLCGLLAAARDHHPAAGGADEHREGLHRGRSGCVSKVGQGVM